MRKFFIPLFFVSCLIWSCEEEKSNLAYINELKLKTGEVIACGPPHAAFGSVGFANSCGDSIKKDFDLGVALLHSFEYDEAEKVFANIIAEKRDCAMAYWGVAMSNYHPLWAPPAQQELEKGAKVIAIAQKMNDVPSREKAYINALAAFYKDWEKTDHRTRSVAYEKAMEDLYKQSPNDKEVTIFYALALLATADLSDKTYSKQLKAGEILNTVYPGQPDHPGIVHYLIHCYDYPELANKALAEARRYASIAPSSAHAQHMPSHIFTRLGLWQECINSNKEAAESAFCYAQSTKIKGHWDEELHALDYQVYGYLQQGDNDSAQNRLQYLSTIEHVSPVNFKVAYASAAMPARYLLENKMWQEASRLEPFKVNVEWQKYPWQKAIIHFARALGSAHIKSLDSARMELKTLHSLRDTLLAQKDGYKANQVDIQAKTAEAWILYMEGKNNEALQLMTQAADMEDRTEKHSVTPGEVLPAKELLGDMLLQMNQPAKALEAYETNLKQHPNRFNGLYGAALAAEKLKNAEKAKLYYGQLVAVAQKPGKERRELVAARNFLK
jgi:tetratricopeptide (TPR) repeat protein